MLGLCALDGQVFALRLGGAQLGLCLSHVRGGDHTLAVLGLGEGQRLRISTLSVLQHSKVKVLASEGEIALGQEHLSRASCLVEILKRDLGVEIGHTRLCSNASPNIELPTEG